MELQTAYTNFQADKNINNAKVLRKIITKLALEKQEIEPLIIEELLLTITSLKKSNIEGIYQLGMCFIEPTFKEKVDIVCKQLGSHHNISITDFAKNIVATRQFYATNSEYQKTLNEKFVIFKRKFFDGCAVMNEAIIAHNEKACDLIFEEIGV